MTAKPPKLPDPGRSAKDFLTEPDAAAAIEALGDVVECLMDNTIAGEYDLNYISEKLRTVREQLKSEGIPYG